MSDRDSFAAGGNRPSERSQRTSWRAGDRVLAPWEPMYLYAGTLEQVAEGRALIQFDDGDAGWVDLEYVQPLVLKKGQRVLSRRKMGPHFFPGEIRHVNGEQVYIDFDDGKEEEGTAASLRISCEPVRRGAQPVKTTSHRAFLEYLRVESRVWALWNNAALFAGTVNQLGETEAHIRFDDGDEAWVQLDHLLPLDFIVGMFVMARRRTNREYFPATISDTEGHRVQVRFEDSTVEWTTAAALALPLQPPQPAAAHPVPTSSVATTTQHADSRAIPSGWNPLVVLAIGGAVVTIIAVLFFLLGRL